MICNPAPGCNDGFLDAGVEYDADEVAKTIGNSSAVFETIETHFQKVSVTYVPVEPDRATGALMKPPAAATALRDAATEANTARGEGGAAGTGAEPVPVEPGRATGALTKRPAVAAVLSDAAAEAKTAQDNHATLIAIPPEPAPVEPGGSARPAAAAVLEDGIPETQRSRGDGCMCPGGTAGRVPDCSPDIGAELGSIKKRPASARGDCEPNEKKTRADGGAAGVSGRAT